MTTEKVSVAFYRGSNNEPFINRLTQQLTGEFVHCEVVFNDPKSGKHNLACGVWQDEVVFMRPKTFGRTTWTFRSIQSVPTSSARAIRNFCHRQVGKPFNKWGLVRCITPFPKATDDTSWFCSELATRAFQEAGYFQGVLPSMVTPSALYEMLDGMSYQDASPLRHERMRSKGLTFERFRHRPDTGSPSVV